jgi:hypothetical protein
MAHIAEEIFQQIDASRVPTQFLYLRDVSKLLERREASVRRGEARRAVRRGLTIEVISELGIEILVDSISPEQRS